MFIAQRYLPSNSVYSQEWIDIGGPQRSKEAADQLGRDVMGSGEFGEVDKYRVLKLLQTVKRRAS